MWVPTAVKEWDSYLDNWSATVAPDANAISPQQLQLDKSLAFLEMGWARHG